MQKIAKKCKKCKKKCKKNSYNFQRNSLMNLSSWIPHESLLRHRHENTKKKCNFQPYGLPFPSPKLHQNAKQKNATSSQNWKCKKCKYASCIFSPSPAKNQKKVAVPLALRHPRCLDQGGGIPTWGRTLSIGFHFLRLAGLTLGSPTTLKSLIRPYWP